MKLTLEEPKILVDSVGVISELVNDVRFSVDEDKISLIAMDPANVAMIIFNLLSSAFTTYKVEKPVNIAINLDSLKAILRRSKPSDVLTITLDEEKNKLQIQLKSDSTRTFNIALIDVEEKELKIGDYILQTKDLNGKILNVGIERKTIQDFLNSIIDKRIINQLIILKKQFDISLLIIEGEENVYEIRNFHPNAIRGMFASIAVSYNVPLIYSQNAKDTASINFSSISLFFNSFHVGSKELKI